MSSLALRYFVMWLGFNCVHNIRKFHGILNEENRNVVANYIPVPFVCVELHSKSTDVTDGVLLRACCERCAVVIGGVGSYRASF